MKKIVCLLIVVLIFVVGCAEDNIGDTKNEGSNKNKNIEIVSKKEYISRVKTIVDEVSGKYINEFENTIDDVDTDYEYLGPGDEKYDFMIKNIENDKSKFGEMAEGFSKFKTRDDKINKIHYKIIEACTDKSNACKERFEIEAKLKNKHVKEWISELEEEAGNYDKNNVITEKEYNEYQDRIKVLDSEIKGEKIFNLFGELEGELGENLD